MQFHWHLDQHEHTDYAARKYRGADGKRHTQFMHTLITGGSDYDHENFNGLDNRRSNLRPASRSDQNAHQRKRASNTSGYIGVCWNKNHGKWQARVKKYGKVVWWGWFDDPEVAARARDAEVLKHFGEFAVLNFPSH